jgi:hypothetical protein
MTKTLHTAAPWHVDFVDTDMVYAANGLRVATTYCDGQDDEMPWEEVEANASLVAAAPELLEALEFIAADIDEGVKDKAAWQRVARRAIAKAKRLDHHYNCDQCGCVHHVDFIGHDKADA